MKIAIVYNGMRAKACKGAEQLRVHGAEHGLDLAFFKFGEGIELAPPVDRFDRVISLGGDGTLLRAAALFRQAGAPPVLGINFGKVGFLTGADGENLIEAFDYAISENPRIERRALLDVVVECQDGRTRAAQALNELVIGRARNARIVATELHINGERIYNLRGDGLIISTTTGSTAYALSAGGPVVAPGYDGMVVVPLASHTLVQRAIVTAPGDEVQITLPDEDKAAITLSCDGVEIEADQCPVERVTVRVSDSFVGLIKLNNYSFYRALANEFF